VGQPAIAEQNLRLTRERGVEQLGAYLEARRG